MAWATVPSWARHPKVQVGAPDDALEREADLVADQVAGTAGSNAGNATHGITEGQRPVGRPTGESGQRLPPSVRSMFEPRLGADLGDVRVHTSDTAAASARSVGARAYAIGSDIVFGAAEFAPSTGQGSRLLAHELVHVLQDRAGARPMLRRQTTTTFQAPPNICSPSQTREIAPAVATAQGWLRAADLRLSAFAAALGTPGAMTTTAGTALSFRRHFATTDRNTVLYVQNMIRLVADRLRTDPNAPNALTVQCHGATDPSCTAASAYVQGALLVFCPGFETWDAVGKAVTMIHEIAHSLPTMTGGLHITDRAYRSDRLYGALSTAGAITNAESYALLVKELATGPVGSTAPRDTFDDNCSPPWRAALTMAAALAQRWNRDAQTIAHDTRPAMLSQWTGPAATFLGGQTPALVAAAGGIYDGAQTRLRTPVDFQCEPDGGGRCDHAQTYWYAWGDFHVCPSWLALASDDARAEALLAGMYGYFRLTDNSTRMWNLARLAHALHLQFWALPTAADMTSALSAAGSQPQPPAAPPKGPSPI